MKDMLIVGMFLLIATAILIGSVVYEPFWIWMVFAVILAIWSDRWEANR